MEIYSIPLALRNQSYHSKAQRSAANSQQLRGRREGSARDRVRLNQYPPARASGPQMAPSTIFLRTVDTPETHDISLQNETNSLCIKFGRAHVLKASKSVT